MAACLHDHECAEHSCGAEWSLFQQVDTPRVRALNEATEGSAQTVLRSWEERLDFSAGCCESNEDDPELLIFIPFSVDVKIKSICVIGGTDGTSPVRMKVFTNREDMDFGNAAAAPAVQEFELAENARGDLEYPTRQSAKYAKFQGVANVTLYFPTSLNGERTRIHFIGFKGEYTQLKRDAVVQNIVYEAAPLPQDHVEARLEANSHLLQ
eukprot:jgi/Chlat1/2117/Chrsp17S02711